MTALAAPSIHAQIVWRELPGLPRALGGQFVGTAGESLVVAGGSYWTGAPWSRGEKVWVDTIYTLGKYDSAWTMRARLAEPLAYGAAVSTTEGLLLFGGQTPQAFSSGVYLFDGQAVRKLGELPEPLAMHGAAVADGVVSLAGGQPTFTPTVALNQVLSAPLKDVLAGKAVWKKLPLWPGRPRFFAQVAAVGDSLSVVGGSDLIPDPSSAPVRLFLFDAFRYSPASGWQKLMPLPRTAQAGLAISLGERLLVMGGSDGTLPEELRERHPGFRKEVYAYDQATDNWEQVGEMPVSLVTTGIAPWGDEFVIAGGEDRPGHRSARVIAGRYRGK
jgi:N-acetylneuraminic acid mutarotase